MKLIFLDIFLCLASERVFILARVICDPLFPVGDLVVQCACLRSASDSGVQCRDSRTAWNNSVPTGRIFMKFDIQGLLESLWGYGRQFLVSLVCSQVEVSVTGRSLVRRSPNERGESECHPKTSARTVEP
jgi:hypothetical protein